MFEFQGAADVSKMLHLILPIRDHSQLPGHYQVLYGIEWVRKVSSWSQEVAFNGRHNLDLLVLLRPL